MNKPHKHAELIKAWADGAEIEWRWSEKQTWLSTEFPSWANDTQYRVKPQPHPHQDLIDAFRSGDLSIQYLCPKGNTKEWVYLKDYWNDPKSMPECGDRYGEYRRAHKWQKEMDAFNAGKTIQWRRVRGDKDGYWIDIPHPGFYTGPVHEYRIKPEPVVKYRAVSLDRFEGVAWLGEKENVCFTFEDGKLVKAEAI